MSSRGRPLAWSLIPFVWGALAGFHDGRARAADGEDWQVHRTGDGARVAQARTALTAAPHRPGLAKSVASSLSDAQREQLRRALCRAAEPGGGRPSYGTVAACAELSAAAGLPTDAAEGFRAALAIRPRSSPAQWGLARALAAAGDPRDAGAAFERAAELAVTSRERQRALTAAAGQAEREGNAARALELYTKIHLAAPREPGAVLALGRAMRRAGQPARAAEILSRAARSASGTGRASLWQEAASAAEEQGDLRTALNAAEAAWLVDVRQRELAQRVIALGEKLGDDDVVLRTYQRLMAADPWDGVLAAAFVERQLRKASPDAGRWFDRVLNRFRTDLPTLARLADAAAIRGDSDRAFAAWELILRRDPRSERAIVAMGELHFQRGRRELARKTWDRLLGAVRPTSHGHAQLAEVLAEHGIMDPAAEHASRAIALAPRDVDVLRSVASVQERRRDRAAAIATWSSVVKVAAKGAPGAPLRREARSRLAGLFAEQGRARLESEAGALRAHLQVEPDDVESALFLSELERRLSRPDRALEALARAADRSPGAPEIAWPLVRLLRSSRQFGEATRRLEALARAAPDQEARAEIELAELALARRDAGAAREAAMRAERADGGIDVRLRAAALRERMGRPDEARAVYRDLVERDGSGRAASALARALVAANDNGQALAVIQAALARAETPEARVDLVRAGTPVAQALGASVGLAASFAAHLDATNPAERSALLDLLVDLVPALGRQALAGDAHAARTLDSLRSWAIKPVVAALTDPDSPATPAAATLLGLLGSAESANALAAALAPRMRDGVESRPTDRAQLESAIAAALGCLPAATTGSPSSVALTALRTLARSPEPAARAPALWALGRLGGASDAATMVEGTNQADAGSAAMAWLGVGRLAPGRIRSAAEAALDGRRPPLVRAGAALAVALAGSGVDDRAAAMSLVALLGSAEAQVGEAAAASLGALADGRTLPGLIERALLGPPEESARAGRALASFGSGLEDEGAAIAGPFTPSAIVAQLSRARAGDGTRASAGATLIEHAAVVTTVLQTALSEPGDRRRGALEAVADRLPASPAFAPLYPAVAGLAADPDPEVRLASLRAGAALGHPAPSRAIAQSAADVAEGKAGAALGSVAAEAKLAELTDQTLRTTRSSRSVRADLLPMLSAADPRIRRMGVRMLARLGREGISDLSRASNDADPLVAGEARRALAGVR